MSASVQSLRRQELLVASVYKHFSQRLQSAAYLFLHLVQTGFTHKQESDVACGPDLRSLS